MQWIALSALMLAHADVPSPSLSEKPLEIKVPASRFAMLAPLSTLPGVTLDAVGDAWGVAQEVTREKGLQARILWIDCTANIDRYNSDEACEATMKAIKFAGFNTVVLDVKPISGQVIYPSKFAPKLTEWKGRQLPPEFDALKALLREAKANQLNFLVSMNAFSEGHRDFKVGPGYQKPALQTVLYDPRVSLVSAFNASFPVNATFEKTPVDGRAIGAFTDKSQLPPPNDSFYYVTINRQGQVLEAAAGTTLRNAVVPANGSLLLGSGDAGNFLRGQCPVGSKVRFDTIPEFVPISERPEQQVPLMMNPNAPEVQDRALAIVDELLKNYDVDGLLYDDRLRYAGMNADFSTLSQFQFEKFVGRRIAWPDDVFKFTVNPSLLRGVQPGPYYEAWLAWRALTIRNFTAQVRETVKRARPRALFGVYAGSSYGDYPRFGHNWAAPEMEAGYYFLTPEYAQTGTASMLDLLVTGCYYPTATIADAMSAGIGLGFCVEAAGQHVNRIVRDQTWTIAGISLDQFRGNPDGLKNALQAACGSTQGVMVFDLSHDIAPMWPVFRQAFLEPRAAPYMTPGLLAEVRKKRSALDKSGKRDGPVPIFGGGSGVGL